MERTGSLSNYKEVVSSLEMNTQNLNKFFIDK